MTWRQVIVLYAVCAVLGAEYWLVERRAMPPAPTQAARQRFLDVDPGDVRELRLMRSGRTVVSARRGDHWEVIEPAESNVPSDLIAAFANALTGAEEIDVMGTPGDPHAYGFDDEAGRIVVLPERGAPLEVTLGGMNATGTAVYARRGGAPAIVLIGRNVRYYEDLIFQALPAARTPAVDQDLPVGG
jgi:hypothetical protein